jgi:hypothetical protein
LNLIRIMPAKGWDFSSLSSAGLNARPHHVGTLYRDPSARKRAHLADAVQRRIVAELFAANISGRIMAGYLIQVHRFLDSFLTLLGAAIAIANADRLEARLRFGRFVGLASGKPSPS